MSAGAEDSPPPPVPSPPPHPPLIPSPSSITYVTMDDFGNATPVHGGIGGLH